MQDRGLEAPIVPPFSDVPSWKVRKKAAQHYAQEKMKWHCVQGDSYHERRAVLCREFKSLAPEEQQPWLTRASSSVPDGCVVADAHASDADNASDKGKAADRAKPVAVLLTWNGGRGGCRMMRKSRLSFCNSTSRERCFVTRLPPCPKCRR